MTENHFEYAVDQKAEGKNLALRWGLVLLYIFISAAYFVAFYIIRIPQFIALLPFLLVFLVFYTWRYVQVTHEYVIAVGEITFSRIYANRKRKQVLKLPIRELHSVLPDDGHLPAGIDRIYDFRGSCKTPDSYCLIFADEKGRACLAYFEATNKALKLMQMYNPSAVVAHGKMRY